MFQYKNSQIIAIIQIKIAIIWATTMKPSYFSIFFFCSGFFFFFFEAVVGVGLFRLVGGRLG
jgi:hypothetical protein